eukprot:4652654-Pyramimonas_sp.AAC.3
MLLRSRHALMTYRHEKAYNVPRWVPRPAPSLLRGVNARSVRGGVTWGALYPLKMLTGASRAGRCTPSRCLRGRHVGGAVPPQDAYGGVTWGVPYPLKITNESS